MAVLKGRLTMNHSHQVRTVNYLGSRLGLAILVIVLMVPTACQPATPGPTSTTTPSVVQIGPVILTNAPTLQEQRLNGTPPPTPKEAPSTTQGAGYQEAATLAEVRQLAGFDFWSPGYLPQGYNLQRYNVFGGKDGVAVEVNAEYISDDFEHLLTIRQIRYSAEAVNNSYEFPIGNALVVRVTVRNQPGVWVEGTNQGAHLTETGKEILVPWNILVWVEDDYYFWFYSSELPLAENLKVAESM
jgi:hypothetical protein